MGKTVIVLGGPNGAGKTTFARQLLLERLPDAFEFLNADMIAEGMSPFKPYKAAIRAGREFVRRIRENAMQENSFALESTLSGLSLASRLTWLQSQGYRVELIYLWLPDADFAVRRVSERVKRGGHDMPEDLIRRRFKRSFANFVTVYRNVTDRWVLLDGSQTPPTAIASCNRAGLMNVERHGHAALLGLLNHGDRVNEETYEYGAVGRCYTENLDSILEAVGEFLRQQETLDKLIDGR